ncbi:toxin-activating lysine-acyltransferase [Veronia pacifica]|uniref:RTX toxin-activating lysine-acyltransferase n=1 Tax=Veronia pacifica TaxID=1080227 RepID=A0A1C3E863_9GAMM|nr:toxin-activating lysine-acyltransferase [Veronia pacifica]ODA29349.1 hypothetical protein A8L45_22320 [Veronia pacifica]
MDVSKEMSNIQLFGHIVWLYSRSELHGNMSIASLQNWVIPAMATNQFRIYHRNGLPVGYVSWAFLSEEVEEQYLTVADFQFLPQHWQSGDRGWVIDFIAPDGDALKIIRDMQRNIFPNTEGRAMRVKPGVDEGVIRKIRGANVKTSKLPPLSIKREQYV